MKNNILVAQNICYNIENTMVLNNINLTISQTDAILLHGNNGSGKSTLLKILNRDLTPTGGTIHTYPTQSTWDRNTILISEHTITEDSTAIEFISYIAKKTVHNSNIIDYCIQKAKIAHLIDLPLTTLSFGQKKRIAMCALLCTKSRIWLLDEPAIGLDQTTTALLKDLIAQHRTMGGAVVVATHNNLFIRNAKSIQL